MDKSENFYNQIAPDFDRLMHKGEIEKRLRIIFGKLLPDDISDKSLLDAGCGTGWFSKEAVERGAKVTSLDIGENLLKEVAKKCESRRVLGDVLNLPFASGSFDIVLSTEVIEHTKNPGKAASEMARVLKPGGVLVLTTPNKLWRPLFLILTRFGRRPYQADENWLSWREVKETIRNTGLKIEKFHGFNLFYPHSLTDWIDDVFWFLGPLMINISVRARK